MNLRDTLTTIALLAQYDPKQVPAVPEERDAKVAAWESLLDPGITLGWLREHIAAHYRTTDEPITPALINQAWRAWHNAQSRVAVFDSERHCGRAACDCAHIGACMKGWLDDDDGKARPCGRCRPWLSRRLAQVPEPAKRTDADGYRLRGEGVDRESIDWTPHVHA